MTSAAEKFWRGDGGKEYTDRNLGKHLVASNTAFFARALARTDHMIRILEFGAGAGLNMTALRYLLPEAQLMAVEVNEHAASQIVDADFIFRSSVQNFQVPQENQPDLVFTKGLLIHIPDSDLAQVYDKLYYSTRRYILVAEYHSPQREEILYRGRPGLLWKGPYAEELMDRVNNRVGYLRGSLRLIDYGFVGKLDRWPQDDVTWWLFSKL